MNTELRRASTYSPVYDSINLNLHEVQINGTFYPPEQPSIARQMPNRAADSVWEDYERVRPVRLTRSQLIRMGKDPSNVSRYEDKHWGYGDDAYVGDLDVFHQLHCLNTLRHYAYADYYNMTALDASDENSLMAHHVNHCVDILLQEIQCSGNVGFITSNWVENQRYPQPDMSIYRKCIAFDNIVTWRNAHSVDTDKYKKVMVEP
ncbi:tat pathway signal sequence [Xylaria digitata]|nr:tat pathway signal sequence [Xylaria digitata]